jgi:hypothetical protein
MMKTLETLNQSILIDKAGGAFGSVGDLINRVNDSKL